MKICLVGPGILEIPPQKYGAVEQLMWENYQDLRSLGHEVTVVNVPQREDIVRHVNGGDFDIVHIHYDQFYDIIPLLAPKVVVISSHYPYMNIRSQWDGDGYTPTFNGIVRMSQAPKTYVFASSKPDIDTLVKGGVPPEKTWYSKLGIRMIDYAFTTSPKFGDRTLCLGKITQRKRQFSLQSIDCIDFAGPLGDGTFDPSHKNYKGAVPRDQLNSLITEYGNGILLSQSENATPLTVKEYLVCGLPVVVSECCGQELDQSLPFISVIPDDRIDDLDFIRTTIEKNRSFKDRNQVREYARSEFGSDTLIKAYAAKMESLL